MRIITVLLLLAVCFFGGVTYGAYEKNNVANKVAIENIQVVEPPETIAEPDLEELEIVNVEEQDYLVNKTASFFEKIVSSLYEIIINMMYSIANLFFD